MPLAPKRIPKAIDVEEAREILNRVEVGKVYRECKTGQLVRVIARPRPIPVRCEVVEDEANPDEVGKIFTVSIGKFLCTYENV